MRAFATEDEKIEEIQRRIYAAIQDEDAEAAVAKLAADLYRWLAW